MHQTKIVDFASAPILLIKNFSNNNYSIGDLVKTAQKEYSATLSNGLIEKYNGNLENILLFKSIQPLFKLANFSDFKQFNSNEKLFDLALVEDSVAFNKIEKDLGQMSSYNALELLISIHQDKDKFVFAEGNVHKIKAKLKGKGTFYTPSKISDLICKQTISNLEKDTIIDLGCGTGNFLLSCIKQSKDKNKTVNNIYGVDIDPVSVAITIIRLANEFPENVQSKIIKGLSTRIVAGNAIFGFSKENKFNFHKTFGSIFAKGGFDAVVMNPPYKVLKVNKTDFFSKDLVSSEYMSKIHLSEKERINTEKEYVLKSKEFPLSSKGMLNYYRIFLEIALKITKSNGKIGAIIPSTLLGDISAKEMRKAILIENNLKSVEYFLERNNLFESVAQSLVILDIEKGKPTSEIKLVVNNGKKDDFVISISEIKNLSSNYEIPLVSKIGWGVLNKISAFKKLGEFSTLKNRRGELDLTMNKKYISTKPSLLKLVRGKNLFSGETTEFVDGTFLKKLSVEKLAAVKHERLAGLQISNIDSKIRLKFKKVSAFTVLGNSCNYIQSEDKEFDLDALERLLNSKLLNWRFKITSTNNHINNYELSQLPLKSFKFGKDACKIDEKIFVEYGLNKSEIDYIEGFYV